MYSLRIQTTHGDPLNFQFKTRDKAQAAYDRLTGDTPQLRDRILDDYDRQGFIYYSAVVSAVLSDLSREVDCSVDLAVFQAQANNRSQAHPLVRSGGLVGHAHSTRRQ